MVYGMLSRDGVRDAEQVAGRAGACLGCQGWHWHGSKLPGSFLFFTFLGGLYGSQQQGGCHVPDVGLPQQTPTCSHHDAHPSSGTTQILLSSPFSTGGSM